MSRLLFAAARGARVQALFFTPTRGWKDVKAFRQDDVYPYRINPDDANLQYGPISTALRREAEEPQHITVFSIPGCLGAYWIPLTDSLHVGAADQLHRSLFLLILSESLADEGL